MFHSLEYTFHSFFFLFLNLQLRFDLLYFLVVVTVEFDPTSYTVTEAQNAVLTVVTDRVSTRNTTVTVRPLDNTARCKDAQIHNISLP